MKLPGSGELDPELDARLVARCIDGDARSWEALVRRHERLVYSIGRSYRLGDEDMADVFQDVFTALLKGMPRLRDGRTLVRWLASTTERIARTTALKRRREAAREDHEEETFATLADAGEAIGANLEQVERQHQLRLALGAVSDRCKRLLEALYYEDPTPSYAELSQRLGVPVGSLGPTRARCMERLKGHFEEVSGESDGITDD
ncbi:MAG TPA: sigma-70 family RNA polymerase sigma factor [Candidatus Eisenbacteria bacterium]|jgi:RNA polymerase sigma factor (sigma-70 family)